MTTLLVIVGVVVGLALAFGVRVIWKVILEEQQADRQRAVREEMGRG